MSVCSRRSIGSSILKKTTTIKDKIVANGLAPQRVRFQLPHEQNVRNILRNYLKEGERREYENLICLIRDSELFDEDLHLLLKEATECISLLNHDLRLFVEALLSIRWNDRSNEIVTKYQSFLVNLLAAHNYHCRIVIDHLISLFMPNTNEEDWPDGVPTEDDCKKCINVHSVINAVLQIVPMSGEMFLKALKSRYPLHHRGVHVNEYYLHNILWVLNYKPSFRVDLFQSIISRLILIDVNAPREFIEKVYEDEEDLFTMDDTKSVKTVCTENGQNANSVLINTLDVSLNRFFNYMLTECLDPQNGELNWDKTKDFYRDLLVIFEEVILPTYDCHHVQFCMFLLCSFKPTLAQGFLDFLWKKVIDPNVPAVIRRTCVAYIAGLLARALYIDIPTLKSVLQQLTNWIHTYISTQDGLECVNSDLRTHSVFYSMCQALFYTVTFRHKELVKNKKGMIFLESLNLTKIVTSRLNPLRVCQPAVVQNFAAFTRNYQLAYCYSIIEHNSRNTMPTIYQDENGAVSISNCILDGLFPFDPFVLRRSREHIQSLYREYEEYNDDEEQDINEVGEVDDFLDQGSASKSSMFSYGTSPGINSDHVKF